jgi:hypothetical protein
MSNLVKRLREGVDFEPCGYELSKARGAMDNAADRIEVLEAALRQARDLIRFQQEWIDAVPDETPLPAMPGFDGDWAASVQEFINNVLKE